MVDEAKVESEEHGLVAKGEGWYVVNVLPNPDGVWRPGLFVTAHVFEPVAAAVVVPRRALQTFEGATVVFVVEGDHFAPRPVTVGVVGRTRAEVTDGLAAGDRYADESAFLVKAELAKGEGGHQH